MAHIFSTSNCLWSSSFCLRAAAARTGLRGCSCAQNQNHGPHSVSSLVATVPASCRDALCSLAFRTHARTHL